ncbi:uncharacterized protein LOC117809074 [Notolabrus celidotus]|uniref:uncharacterized protein LOC117809074 n=1 Tax=Notolabrus celidotus TaxID=1203425 RepID=UPI00148FA9DF|nr:uncharacterized protein LOC117809074 [Notolabrus celidotus]
MASDRTLPEHQEPQTLKVPVSPPLHPHIDTLWTRLAAAGLGDKRLTFQGSQENPDKFRDFLFEAFPPLRQGGGFELLKISGTIRSRQLVLIPCPNEGYHVRHLKDPQTQIGHATIFIRPLQRTLNLEPIGQPGSSNELAGPPQKCVPCEEEFPFSSIKAHIDECMRQSQSSVEEQMEVAGENLCTPQRESRFVSMLTRSQESLTARASNTEISKPHQGEMHTHEITDLEPAEDRGFPDWKIKEDPAEAAMKFKEDILNQHATGKPLSLVMDLGDSAEDRERTILSFYKLARVEWASPLTCTLKPLQELSCLRVKKII